MPTETESTADHQGSKEPRTPYTVSVGIFLSNSNPGYYNQLVLVQKRDTRLWGLIAGGMKDETDPRQAAIREAGEEANLTPDKISINGTPETFIITPHPSKYSLGLLYSGSVHRPIPNAGYEPQSDEIGFVKPFTIENLIELIHQPHQIYRPEFNLRFIRRWIQEYIRWKYGSWEGSRFARQVAEAWDVLPLEIDF